MTQQMDSPTDPGSQPRWPRGDLAAIAAPVLSSAASARSTTRYGRERPIAGVPPGIRVLDVSGLIRGRQRRAQVAAEVRAGSTVDQTITLE